MFHVKEKKHMRMLLITKPNRISTYRIQADSIARVSWIRFGLSQIFTLIPLKKFRILIAP